MKQGERSMQVKIGDYTYTLFPEVYYRFVSELHKNHQDLLHAMQIAKVQVSDGTAIQFLNVMLGTNISLDCPMELGYAELLDALKQRVVSPITIANMNRIVTDHFMDQPIFQRAPEDEGKPIFPDEPNQ